MSTRPFELFFIAFYKHDAPQHIVDGPFYSEQGAQEKIDAGNSPQRCIIKTTLQFELIDSEHRHLR